MNSNYLKKVFAGLALICASTAHAQSFSIHAQDACTGGALANRLVSVSFPNATVWTSLTDASGNAGMSLVSGDPTGTYVCQGGLGASPASVSTTKGGANVNVTFVISGPQVVAFNLNGLLATDVIPYYSTYATYTPYSICSGGAFSITNLTSYSSLVSQYQVTVYNANVYGTPGTQVGQITWQATCPTDIHTIMPAPTGQLLVVKLETKNSCGTTIRAQMGLIQWNAVAAPVAGFTINSTNAATGTSCGGGELTTFGCTAYNIVLANLSSGSTQYNVDLYSYTSCSTYTSVYSSGYVSTFPTDLKNLPGTNGTWLQTHTGNFKVVLTSKNSCGTVSSAVAGYINVTGAPTGLSISLTSSALVKTGQTITIGTCTVPALKTINYDNVTPLCSSTLGYHFTLEPSNYANAQPVGPVNTNFLFSATGGTGSYTYDITAKTEKWNGTAWVNMNYNGVAEDLGQSPSVGLSSLLTDNPTYSYASGFGDPTRTPDGTPFKITFTITNECASVAVSQVIKMNRTQLKVVSFEQKDPMVTDINTEYNVSSYPNPAGNEINFNVNAKASDVINITLQDIQGRKVADVKTNAIAADGENVFNANLIDLKPGMYFYRITINNNLYSGKIIKE